MTDVRKETAFAQLPGQVQKKVLNWVKTQLRPVPWTNRHVSTYGLLDAMDEDTGMAISARQLNQALLQAGYHAMKSDRQRDPSGLSWNWNVGIRSPYFLRKIRS